MLFQRKVVCPRCQASRCRESRWLSLEEKRNHQGSTPFRCLDCSYRFLSQERSGFGRGSAISTPLAVFFVGMAIAASIWLTSSANQSVLPPAENSAANDPGIKIAAEGGDAGAQFRLGQALLQDPSRSVENSAHALRWLQMSAENGNTEAMIVLGRLSRSGVGLLQNYSQASKWIQTAADRGNPEGMLELGRLYRDGIGLDKDPVRAYVWFNRASAARNLDAVREREAVARTLTADELKEAQSRSAAQESGGEQASEARTRAEKAIQPQPLSSPSSNVRKSE